MKASLFKQDPDDKGMWIAEEVKIPGRPAIAVIALNEGGRPDAELLEGIDQYLATLDELTLAAAELILENYSYDHFKKAGVAEKLLVKEETPEAMAAAITLQTAVFFEPDAQTFELSFEVPWDDQHSYDVEFEDGEAVSCSVNG